jgi:hypothetical protein
MAGMPEHEFLISGERAALGLPRREQLPRLAAWFNTGAVLIAPGLRVAVERR